MSLKDMIKEELEKALGEINMPFKVAMEIKNLDDNISRLMAQRDSLAREHGEQPRYAKMVRDMGGLTREGDDPLKYVDPENRPMSPEQKKAAIKRQGMRHGEQGVKPHQYTDPDVQAAYMKAYKKGKANKRLPYA